MSIPVRIKDIAQKIGVSQVTVSLALRNHRSISFKRRQEVQEIAQAMGYRPNAMATSLAHRKWTLSPHATATTLAWLNTWPNPLELRRFHEFDAYWNGACEAAEQRGYQMEEFVLNDSMPAKRLQKILSTRAIRGILIPPQPDGTRLQAFDLTSYAMIRFGRSVDHPPVNLVSHSQAIDVTMALHEMAKLGYQRIGYVTSARMRRVSMFDAGYLKSQPINEDDKSLSLPILLLEDYAKPSKAILSKIRTWMQKVRPDAILTTEGNLKALFEAAGYRIPNDVALAATSVSDCDTNAGIFQNPKEIGRVAVLSLIGLIQNNQFGVPEYHQDILVRGKWITGSDLPPR